MGIPIPMPTGTGLFKELQNAEPAAAPALRQRPPSLLAFKRLLLEWRIPSRACLHDQKSSLFSS